MAEPFPASTRCVAIANGSISQQKKQRELDRIALRHPHTALRHHCDKRDAQRQRDADDNRVNGGKFEIREVDINGLMRSGTSVRIDAAKQAIADANERLIFPCVTALRALSHTGFAVFQHSGAPLLEIAPGSLKSSKR